VADFKANLSSILERVQNQKEEFVIEYGKKHKKVAKIVPYEEEKPKKREFGIYEGMFKIPDNFNEEDEEINKMFYDSEIFPCKS